MSVNNNPSTSETFVGNIFSNLFQITDRCSTLKTFRVNMVEKISAGKTTLHELKERYWNNGFIKYYEEGLELFRTAEERILNSKMLKTSMEFAKTKYQEFLNNDLVKNFITSVKLVAEKVYKAVQKLTGSEKPTEVPRITEEDIIELEADAGHDNDSQEPDSDTCENYDIENDRKTLRLLLDVELSENTAEDDSDFVYNSGDESVDSYEYKSSSCTDDDDQCEITEEEVAKYVKYKSELTDKYKYKSELADKYKSESGANTTPDKPAELAGKSESGAKNKSDKQSEHAGKPSELTGKSESGAKNKFDKASELAGKSESGAKNKADKPSELASKPESGAKSKSDKSSELAGKSESGAKNKSDKPSELASKPESGAKNKSDKPSELASNTESGAKNKSDKPSEHAGKAESGAKNKSDKQSELASKTESGAKNTPDNTSEPSAKKSEIVDKKGSAKKS